MIVRTLAVALITAVLLIPGGQEPAEAAKRYTPRAGVTFNSPLGTQRVQRAIYRKIIQAIDGSRRGSDIDIFSWNFLTRDGKEALLRAQRRGIRVRLLMAESNNIQIANGPYRTLRRQLRRNNKGRPKARRSWARVCEKSCRGRNGVAHAKYYLFSRVGRASDVVIQGSANFTVASTTNQWNDIYTHRNEEGVYNFYHRAFEQSARDRRVRPTYLHRRFGDAELMLYPNIGRRVKDPVMGLLNKINCRRATNTGTGRTVIRIAPDVVRNKRGMVLARKVRALWDSGCDVKLGYTVMGIDVGKMLREDTGRGPVPLKHLAQDFDDDGQFDNYFHLKAMSVVGNVAGKRGNFVTLNGSANWSRLAKVSDENVGIYWNRRLTLKYQGHIDYWFDNFPERRQRLVFGYGREAVTEDGKPAAEEGVNPFATMGELTR